MRTARITAGGQVSIPAEVRHRWGSSRVLIDDHGDALVLRPLPDDPIAAARGALKDPDRPAPTTDEVRRQLREEEAEATR